jgi:hypothetical protein
VIFTKRGSFGTKSRAFRVNHGSFYRPTSVTILGVNSRKFRAAKRRHEAANRPTKAERLGKLWRLKPGLYQVTYLMSDKDSINVVIDGGQMTFPRVQRITEALDTQNGYQATRAAKTFIRSWDITDENDKVLPITPKGVQTIGVEMLFGLAVEAANAMDIPKDHFAPVLKHRESGDRVKVIVRPIDTQRAAAMAVGGMALEQFPVTRPQKSMMAAYVLWVFTGLVGGHRYYLGRPGTGFLMTITLGGLGVWWLIDAFLIPRMID